MRPDFQLFIWLQSVQLDEIIPTRMGYASYEVFQKPFKSQNAGTYRVEFVAIGSPMLKRVPRPGSLSQ